MRFRQARAFSDDEDSMSPSPPDSAAPGHPAQEVDEHSPLIFRGIWVPKRIDEHKARDHVLHARRPSKRHVMGLSAFFPEKTQGPFC